MTTAYCSRTREAAAGNGSRGYQVPAPKDSPARILNELRKRKCPLATRVDTRPLLCQQFYPSKPIPVQNQAGKTR